MDCEEFQRIISEEDFSDSDRMADALLHLLTLKCHNHKKCFQLLKGHSESIKRKTRFISDHKDIVSQELFHLDFKLLNKSDKKVVRDKILSEYVGA